LLTDREAIQDGHGNIKQYQVRRFSLDEIQGLPAIYRRDRLIAVALEDAHQEIKDRRIVVYNEYFR